AHLACATSLNHAFGQIGSRLRALGVAQHVFEQHLQRIWKLLGALILLNTIQPATSLTGESPIGNRFPSAAVRIGETRLVIRP
ncbi:hypothetical protein, partial [Prevotella sp.]|uniref:hypothetical protein n=1 Tax=Prevotella sp. TaxID=59823 RepID=UPI0027E39753